MRIFYMFLLHWAEFDLWLARTTGRGQQYVAMAAADVDRWMSALIKLEINA